VPAVPAPFWIAVRDRSIWDLRRFATLARCRRGVTATSATSHGIGCAAEYCKRRRIERIGLLDPAPASPFPVRPRGLPAVSVCRRLSYSAHPLVRFTFPPESTNQRRPGSNVRAPSLGFLPSSRHRPVESTHASFPSSLRSAHDVSHVLDGLLLHQPLRVYFTPQPRPGFALQGISLAKSRTSSSLAVALMPLARHPCQILRLAPGCRARLQGLAPLANPSQNAAV
jgi:hypothetical protein